jgi:DNA-binding response OmpR family regulator
MILFNKFCSQNEIIFTFEEVSELIYPFDDYNINKIRMLIKRLKKKLNYSDTLSNVHNIGYKFKKCK